MRVYVAGPLSASSITEGERNVNAAMRVGIALMQRGHQPYVPHLSVFMDRYSWGLGVVLGYEEWLALDRVWLGQCEALLYLGPSPGADRERAWAEELGLPVYLSVDDLPAAGGGATAGAIPSAGGRACASVDDRC